MADHAIRPIDARRISTNEKGNLRFLETDFIWLILDFLVLRISGSDSIKNAGIGRSTTMAKRERNNPRITNSGYVEDHYCLDIRRLGATKNIIKGARTAWTEYGPNRWEMTADLEVASQAFMTIEHSYLTTQKIEITWKSNRANRQRLFFVDDTGRKSEKLYYVGGRFVSRQVGKLTFRSQSCGLEDRLRKMQEPVRKKLESGAPLAPEQRLKLEFRYNELRAAEKQVVEFDFWQNKWNASDHRKAERTATQERLKLAKKAVRRRRHVGADDIIARHADRLAELRKSSPRAGKSSDLGPKFFAPAPPPLPKMASEAVLDTDLLRRMKLLKDGHLTAMELGWPIKWLPQRRRQIHVLFDLRDRAAACVLIVFQTPRSIISQLFWIVAGYPRYGADTYTFEDPYTGKTSDILSYESGRFALARRPVLPTLYSLLLRRRQLQMERLLSGRSELTEEHVEVLQQLGKTPGFYTMYDDFLEQLAELGDLVEQMRAELLTGPDLDANWSQIPIRPAP